MKIAVTYIGLRINGPRVEHAFLDDKGEIGFWQKVKWCQIGHRYESIRTKKAHTMKRRPDEMGDPVEDEKVLNHWKLEDEAAREFRRRKAAVAKAENFKFGDDRLETLRDRIQKLDNRTHKLVIEAVVAYLNGWSK